MPLPKIPAPPPDALEIFLQPGELYFGDRNTRIRTVLGSCVAIVLWHPQRLIGGMCHFMLPRRKPAGNPRALDGRYADEAVQLFMRELRQTGTRAVDYQVKLFGGGSMFEPIATRSTPIDISGRNVETARTLLSEHGFGLHAHDLGGNGHRNLVFDVWSGEAWLRNVPRHRVPAQSS